ncbi:MAG: hypothetical protein DRP06_00760 [Candidatus Aenigmatarchaeota archaeon]|nr:MAG: hypothetical protein DRP06_00760 [Candidatus Aenigmarchaeota archaeon]
MLYTTLKNSETKTIEQVHSDFLENPSGYINTEIPGYRRGVDYYRITPRLFDRIKYDFTANLLPEVFDCTQEEFIIFFGKTLQLINKVSEDEIPLQHVELLGSVNFKQKDGNDDRRTFYPVPTIIKGNNLKDASVEIGRRTESSDYDTLYVHNLEGAQISDFFWMIGSI